MAEHGLEPDGDLTPEQAVLVQALTDADVREIDRALLSHATHSWRKAAFVIGSAMMSGRCSVEEVPDLFYALRLKKLVGRGMLEAYGNLDFMRYSEIRLPQAPGVERQCS